jgi:hypothetical protein
MSKQKTKTKPEQEPEVKKTDSKKEYFEKRFGKLSKVLNR